jgi:tripartite-type tricarboxylate transporter receptor subunit TctC
MTVIAAIPNVLLVNPKVAASSVQDFVSLVKNNPGKLNYASQGNGTTSHLTTELFKSMAGGLQITHIPYKGTAPALADLLGGQVDLMFDNLGVSLPHVRSGKLKALAVTSVRRVSALPETPTRAESLPGFESGAWFGIVAPPKTSSAIADKVANGTAEALRDPGVLRRLAEMSAEPMGLTPSETAAFMKQETERWGAVIRSAGVRLD